MTTVTSLHVNFRGEAREALAFYHSVFGGDLVAVPYGDTESGQDPDQAEQIAWGEVSTTDGFRIMAYDVQASLPHDAGRNAYYHALRSTDADSIVVWWHGLAEGAEVIQPLGPSTFSPLYGKLTDRFGVTWIIDVIVPWSPAEA